MVKLISREWISVEWMSDFFIVWTSQRDRTPRGNEKAKRESI